MRRLGTLSNQTQVQEICRLFTTHDIRYTIESQKDQSWGSLSYGLILYSIFIEDEDDIERASALFNQATEVDTSSIPPTKHLAGPCEHATQNYLQQRFGMPFATKQALSTSKSLFTLLIALFCIGVFIVDMHSRTPSQHFFSPIQRVLSFDYPHGLQLTETLIASETPPKSIQERAKKTFVWGGLYPYIVDKVHHSDALPKQAVDPALFLEKVRNGEAWRLFSPCLLHSDIFHLVFNLLWLIALGNQIEKRLPLWRFAILLLSIALISNTAQYCMSGPFFFGMSGVIFGLLGFISQRNTLFPWEGYSLQPTAYSCILFFMWALVFLSFCSFLATWYLDAHFPIGFANTAHVTGLVAGIQLGKASFFCAKKNQDVV